MPILKNLTAFQIARGITAFLNLEAGLIRGKAPDLHHTQVQAEEELKQARAQIATQGQDLAQARARIEAQREQLQQRRRWAEKKDRQAAHLLERKVSMSGLDAPASGIDPKNIIWIFGTIRTGSTWLGSMMRDLKKHALWNEPRVGELFGYYFYERAAHRQENENFILGLQRKLVWLKSIRAFTLDSVSAKYPRLAKDSYLVIKEPSGSIGAPLLMEALPESRMILLVRDPRDVVASTLDAGRKGSWAYQLKGNRKRRKSMGGGPDEQSVTGPEKRADGFNKPRPGFLKTQAAMYLRDVGNSKWAYEAHEGPKVLVKYEDLRTNTLGTMKRIYSALEIDVEEEELARTVEKHSWERIPEEKKGAGKFHRKATPGGWREDLTPEQVEIVEGITAPLLKEFYPE